MSYLVLEILCDMMQTFMLDVDLIQLLVMKRVFDIYLISLLKKRGGPYARGHIP